MGRQLQVILLICHIVCAADSSAAVFSDVTAMAATSFAEGRPAKWPASSAAICANVVAQQLQIRCFCCNCDRAFCPVVLRASCIQRMQQLPAECCRATAAAIASVTDASNA